MPARLGREYLRDLGRFLRGEGERPALPENYFDRATEMRLAELDIQAPDSLAALFRAGDGGHAPDRSGGATRCACSPTGWRGSRRKKSAARRAGPRPAAPASRPDPTGSSEKPHVLAAPGTRFSALYWREFVEIAARFRVFWLSFLFHPPPPRIRYRPFRWGHRDLMISFRYWLGFALVALALCGRAVRRIGGRPGAAASCARAMPSPAPMRR